MSSLKNAVRNEVRAKAEAQMIAVAEEVGRRVQRDLFRIVRDSVRQRMAHMPWIIRNISLLAARWHMKQAAKYLGPAVAFVVMAEVGGSAQEKEATAHMMRQILTKLDISEADFAPARERIRNEVDELGGMLIANIYAEAA